MDKSWKNNNYLKEDKNLSPVPLDSIIKTTPLFEKSFKKLKLTNEDLEELKNNLKTTSPRAGYGYGIYKQDFWPKRFNLSPHEGRVIYIIIRCNNDIYLFDIYKKNEKQDIEKSKIEIAKDFAKKLNGDIK